MKNYLASPATNTEGKAHVTNDHTTNLLRLPFRRVGNRYQWRVWPNHNV